jgi:hypothetical protein
VLSLLTNRHRLLKIFYVWTVLNDFVYIGDII